MPTSSTSVCVTTTTATRDSESGSARARGSITREFRVAPEKTNARVAGAARLAIPQARQMVRHVRARQLDTDRGRIMRASANIVTLGREVLCYPDHRPDHRRQLPTRRPFTPSDRTHADRERPQRVDTRGCQRQLGRLSLSATKRREKRAIYRCDSQRTPSPTSESARPTRTKPASSKRSTQPADTTSCSPRKSAPRIASVPL